MPVVYFDTSAFVKFYFEEDGTARIVELVTGTDGVQTAILDLAQIESRSAIRRREREGAFREQTPIGFFGECKRTRPFRS